MQLAKTFNIPCCTNFKMTAMQTQNDSWQWVDTKCVNEKKLKTAKTEVLQGIKG